MNRMPILVVEDIDPGVKDVSLLIARFPSAALHKPAELGAALVYSPRSRIVCGKCRPNTNRPGFVSLTDPVTKPALVVVGRG